MKRLVLVVGAVVAVTACGVGEGAVKQKRLPDGRVVTCVYSSSGEDRTVDCDWEHAR